MAKFTPHPSDAIAINTIRTLAADVVAKANSGHPGQFISPHRSVHTDAFVYRRTHGHGTRGSCAIHPVCGGLLFLVVVLILVAQFLQLQSKGPEVVQSRQIRAFQWVSVAIRHLSNICSSIVSRSHA